MGGFAAINFSESLNAHKFIAISPQFSIDPTQMHPSDNRYRFEFSQIDYKYDFIASNKCISREGYIFYDDKHLDKFHAESILAKTKAEAIEVTYSDHPSAPMVNKTYGLKRILFEVATDTLNVTDIRQTIKSKTKESIEYLATHHHNTECISEIKRRAIDNDLNIHEVIYILNTAIKSEAEELTNIALFISSTCHQNTPKSDEIKRMRARILHKKNLHEAAFIELIGLQKQNHRIMKEILIECDDLDTLQRILDFNAVPHQLLTHSATSIKESKPIHSELIMDFVKSINERATLFRDLALQHEEKNIRKAYLLMKQANQIKPDGPFIRNKLSIYMKKLNLNN
ncbi:hypothetical protein C7H85_04305 [Zobellella endophytica]|uniref:Uncharacterized protein n=2 Tax=Zobellella endophytica TaxID=2116700 RepID=A0A2P7RCR5_9GAMM|nr:hypothetical protein C7H85_04305 [Zobellella endophytica]